MTINPLDSSNYFRGLLVLAGNDKKITQNEKKSLRKIGSLLGFNHAFVNSAIDDFTNNKYLRIDIPRFSNGEIAELFLKDGIKLAFVNNTLAVNQIIWLIDATIQNKLSKQWLFIELENYLDKCNSDLIDIFELQKYTVNTDKESTFVS